MHRRRGADGVVITGMGVVCSIGMDVESFTAALRQGRSGIQPIAGAGENEPRAEARIPDFDFAAALAARRSLGAGLVAAARRAAWRSPLPVQVAVIASLQAWEGARLHEAPLPPDRIGLVVAGHNLNGRYAQHHYPKYAANPAYLPARFALHFQDTDHVGTLSQVLGITGEGFTVGGASASGNVGIIHGSRLVESAAADACLVVGALTDLSALEIQSFVNVGAMAVAGGDRAPIPGSPFDRGHEGFVYGQGCACLVLEAEPSARARGATIWAELAGYDLRLAGNGLADPCERAEALVMANAIKRCGVEPHEVAYVNAHGTGSPLGDETEVRALRRAFGAAFTRPWINSTKGLSGHCLCAAGVLEAVSTVVQMVSGFVHPNAGLTQPIDADCRFTGGSAEPADIGLALSNGFGFGGFNSSVLLCRRRS